MEKVAIPREIAEWLKESKEQAAYCTVRSLAALKFPQEEIDKQIELDKKRGIDQVSMFRSLANSAECGIDQWMEDIPNSFEVACRAITDGYEINGSIEESND